jgi:FAD/FMN-containing dehydrogenase
MRGVQLDGATARVHVQGGARLGDVDAALVPAGRLVPSGIVTDTGVGGLTLGGGIGWTARCFGLTCDHVAKVEMVTATGEVVVVNDMSAPDLLWALRGGGGNLGVVSRFTFRTRAFDPTVTAGFVVYPLDRDILLSLAEAAAHAGWATTTIIFLRHAPPVPWMPPAVAGRPVIMAGVAHAGSPADGLRAATPFRRLGPALVDTIAPGPFLAHQSVIDAANPAGHRYYWSSQYVAGLDPGLAGLLVDQAWNLSAPGSLIGLFQLGGAIKEPSAPSCVPFREASFLVTYGSHWLDSTEDDRHRDWTRAAVRATAGFGLGGGYINFESEHLPASDTGTRLDAVKRAYDPDNVFGN